MDERTHVETIEFLSGEKYSALFGKFQSVTFEKGEFDSFLLKAAGADDENHYHVRLKDGEDKKYEDLLKKFTDEVNASFLNESEEKKRFNTLEIKDKLKAFLMQKNHRLISDLYAIPKDFYIEGRLLCGVSLNQIRGDVTNNKKFSKYLKEYLHSKTAIVEIPVQTVKYKKEEEVHNEEDERNGIVYDNTSSPFDAEAEVRNMNNGDFDTDESIIEPKGLDFRYSQSTALTFPPPRKRIQTTKQPQQLTLDFTNLKNEENEFRADNGRKDSNLRGGIEPNYHRTSNGKQGDIRKGGDSIGNRLQPSPQNHRGEPIQDTIAGEKGDDGGVLGAVRFAEGMGERGRPANEGDGAGISRGEDGSGIGGGEYVVRGVGGVETGHDSSLQSGVVRKGIGDVHLNEDEFGTRDERIVSGNGGVGNDNTVRRIHVEDHEEAEEVEAEVFNESAFLDSEHHVEIPKAGTISAFKANVRAIRTLSEIIERNDFRPTIEEQEILKKFTGFGGTTTKFVLAYSESASQYMGGRSSVATDALNDLKSEGLLSDEEVVEINSFKNRMGTLNEDLMLDEAVQKLGSSLYHAYKSGSTKLYGFNESTEIRTQNLNWSYSEYLFLNEFRTNMISSFVSEGKYDYWTPNPIGRLYDTIINDFGIKKGFIIEPSSGIGNILHTFDRETISRFGVTCVEPNIVTGLINKMLNPNANVILSKIERTNIGHFTVSLTNIPFVDGLTVADKKFNNNPDKRYRRSLNNLTGYFPLKMMEQTQPGGLMICLATTSFMNAAKYESERELLSEKANLVCAVRLPSGVFPDTDVNTDLLVFQKKRDGQKQETLVNDFVKSFVQTIDGDLDSKYKVNEYFLNNPENIIGTPTKVFRGVAYQSELPLGDIAAKAEVIIKSAISKYRNTNRIEVSQTEVMLEESKPLVDTTKQIAVDYLALKETYNGLIRADIDNLENSEQLRKKLNEDYDGFVLKYGYINSDRVKKQLQDDKPDFLKVAALEIREKKETIANGGKTTYSYRKSDIFDHRTINKNVSEIESTNPKELVMNSFATKGTIDLDFLERKLGEKWRAECGDLIFKNPETERYELANIYLSGHIGDKLDVARMAAEQDGEYLKNVEALEKVMPKRITIDEITVNMGADIVDVETYKLFIKTELMNLKSVRDINGTRCNIRYNDDHTWSLTLTAKEQNLLRGYDVRKPSFNARAIIEAALNDQYVKVTERDDKGNYVVNESLTLVANSKVKEIRESFMEWIHTKAPKQSMDAVEDNFNRRFNQYVATNWENMQIQLEGCTMSPREHQRNVVARGLTNDDLLMHHAVGAGKTLAMGMTMMERIRLGIASKCALLTMKSNAPQIADEIQKAYPNARILFPNDKDFESDARNTFLNRIKHSDADIVILTHDQFCKIKHEQKYREMFVNWQIESIRELRANAEDGTISERDLKRLSKMEENLISELENENEKLSKDDVSWSELGFDNMAVDEAHVFKNLMFQTSHDKVRGINSDSNSKRSSHLFMAVRDIQAKNGGDKGVIFATGTPISNSLTELYNWQVYLVPSILRRQGINCFDKWADVFAQRQNDWEPDELGRPKLVERFRSFVNLQPLLTTYKGFADVITEKDLIERNLLVNKPTAEFVQVVVPFDSRTDKAIFNELKSIMDNGQSNLLGVHLDEKSFSARSLVVLSKGTKASLTPKLLGLDESQYGTVHNKVEYVAKNVAKIYEESSDALGTQLIFSDTYQGVNYNLYDDIKNILVEKYGIPANEIVDINTVKENDKNAFFEKVNDGEVRVVLGSTQKLGTGVNVQKRACAAHMLDVNWTPSGMVQKVGRVARQGNLYANQLLDNKVPVYLYVKEQSTDAKKYGLVFAKQRMIEQITDTNFKGNTYDEGISNTEAESEIFQELLASATGDNTTMVKNRLESQYRLLEREFSGFETFRYNIGRNIQIATDELKHLQSRYDFVKRMTNTLEYNDFKKNEKGGYPFLVDYDDKTYTSAKELGNAMAADITSTIEAKGFLNKKLEAYGMTAMLQGVHNKGFTVEITEYERHSISETDGKSLPLVKQIDIAEMSVDSIGRTLNNLCLGLGERKKKMEDYISETASSINNLQLQQENNKVFPKQEEMNRMRCDINLLERTLKGFDFGNEVNTLLIQLSNQYETERLFLVRDESELKLYSKMSKPTVAEIASKTGLEATTDRFSSNQVIRLTNDDDIEKVLCCARSEIVEVVYVDNMSDAFKGRVNDFKRIDVSSVKDFKEVMTQSWKDEKVMLEEEKKRLDELRNTSQKNDTQEETDEVRQMKTNVISWKELGFPDPKTTDDSCQEILEVAETNVTNCVGETNVDFVKSKNIDNIICKKNSKEMEIRKDEKTEETPKTMVQDGKDAESKEIGKVDKTKSFPAQVRVGFGQNTVVKDKNGKAVDLIVPKIRIQIDMKTVNENLAKMNVSKNKDGEDFIHFAIIKNKKAKENQSPYLIIARRHGQDATLNGKTVKFADASALMEFSASLKELNEKAKKAGIDTTKDALPLSIGSFSGKTGVRINDKSPLVTTKDLTTEDFEIRGRSSLVNQFDRIVKTKHNLDDNVKDVRYENKIVGDGNRSGREVKLKQKDGSVKKITVDDLYLSVSSKSIKFLPEADAFGNIKLAICKRNSQNPNKANETENNRKADLTVVADPKTYKNGQPFVNTVTVVTMNKDEFLKLPTLSDDDKTIALRVDGLTNKVSLNTTMYVKEAEVVDRLKIDISKPFETKVPLNAVTERYNPKIASLEALSWDKNNPKLDKETFKNSPSQYDLFKSIAVELAEKQAKAISSSVKNNEDATKKECMTEETEKEGRLKI